MRKFIDIFSEAKLSKTMFTPEISDRVEDNVQPRFNSIKPSMSIMGSIRDDAGKEFFVWGMEDDTEARYYAGTLEDRCVGYLILRKFSPDFPDMKYVSMTFVTKKFRRLGVAKALYVFALQRGITIVSDAELTPGSRGIWKSLGSDPTVDVTLANDVNDMHEKPLNNIRQAFLNLNRRMVARLKSNHPVTEGYHDGDEVDVEEESRRLVDAVKHFSKTLPITVELRPYYSHGSCRGVILTDLYASQPGSGTGTKVMTYMCGLADESGLSLYTDASNDQSKAFYMKFGFERSKISGWPMLQRLGIMPRYYFDE